MVINHSMKLIEYAYLISCAVHKQQMQILLSRTQAGTKKELSNSKKKLLASTYDYFLEVRYTKDMFPNTQTKPRPVGAHCRL